MEEAELYTEYEKILLGKKYNYPSSFFNGAARAGEKNALTIMRYGFSLLRWTPQDVLHYVNRDILKLMKLDVLVKYIGFPDGLSPREDLYYLAHALYPRQVPYNIYTQTIDVYKKVLNKQLYTFPKRYLRDEESGLTRIKICFLYVMKNFLFFHSVQEMYSFFSGPQGTKALSQYMLLSACSAMFETPLDLLHESLSEAQKDPFFYQYYKFQYLYRQAARSYRHEMLADS